MLFKNTLQIHMVQNIIVIKNRERSRVLKKHTNVDLNLSTQLSESYKECDRKLYNLILKRTITSHMKHAVYDVCKIQLTNEETKEIGYYEGSIKSSFEGFLK